MSQVDDVLIVGAGPTGLTMAVDLARSGVSHRIIERSSGPSTSSKAKTIQPRALEVLDDLSAVTAVTARGVIDLPTRFHDPSGATIDKPTMSVRAGDVFGSPYPDPVWIGQFDVEAALRDRLALLGGRVEYDMEDSCRQKARHPCRAPRCAAPTLPPLGCPPQSLHWRRPPSPAMPDRPEWRGGAACRRRRLTRV
jgi:2-polyprenyl-6-methoxyphenol hydroxylase-like FAD-dependent oxidoreductase